MDKIIYFFDGLGNQMFQYSFYVYMKQKYKNVYGDLSSFKKYEKIHNGYELKKIFDIKIEEKYTIFNEFFSRVRIKKINIVLKIIHKIFRTLKIIIYLENWNENIEERKNKKNIIFFTGWWQSEKFFKELEFKVRKDFVFPDILDEDNRNIKNMIENSNSISLHIRRGDYLKDKGLGGLAPLFYYKSAIEYIVKLVENPVFYIFSNDAEWCKENLKIDFPTYYIDWNKGEENFRDMQLMSLCKHNIIPNSTFSWWGAWLNENPDKIVIAPEKWFNDCLKMNYSNIVPETWIKIKNY